MATLGSLTHHSVCSPNGNLRVMDSPFRLQPQWSPWGHGLTIPSAAPMATLGSLTHHSICSPNGHPEVIDSPFHLQPQLPP
ncbi:hypothetical protein DPMN_090562 [Dreissena polymorpha]|uniref:Uncharacterized protein n=1 Tax=Dreissena polymorpha TaxID=45954 RepID=A0A9D4QZ43_DREPO|nr:hypothetical protein DPMN_090562 [Dreissena polymorpha]